MKPDTTISRVKHHLHIVSQPCLLQTAALWRTVPRALTAPSKTPCPELKSKYHDLSAPALPVNAIEGFGPEEDLQGFA